MTKEIIPFNFDELLEGVRQKFDERGFDTEIGSNGMQLAVSMAYLISMFNASSAMNIDESFLLRARKRNNVLENARQLGYEIKHKVSYRYILNLDFPKDAVYVIENGQEFTANDKTYYYFGEPIVITGGTETPVSSVSIEVIEGEFKKYENNPELVTEIITTLDETLNKQFNYFIDIPFIDVEEDGLFVYVSYLNDDGDFIEKELWKQADTFVLDKATILKRVYARVDNIETRTPRIYFKMGNTGKLLGSGSVVYIDVLISSGSKGEIQNLEDIDTGDLDCIVTGFELSVGGSEEEETDSIRNNAPLFNNSANRIVTKLDYKTYLKRDGRIKHIDIWDGNDEYPNKPGHVWNSIVPENYKTRILETSDNFTWELSNLDDPSYWYLEDNTYKNIVDDMESYRIPTLTFNKRNPVYLDFNIIANIKRYNQSMTVIDRNNGLFNNVNNYFLKYENFGVEFFQSNLIKQIDAYLGLDSGIDVSLSTSITLNDYNIVHEKNILGDSDSNLSSYIIFNLGTPFEKFYGGVAPNLTVTDVELLPKVTSFYSVRVLEVDFDSETKLKNFIYEYDIIHDPTGARTIVGKYRVFLDTRDTIEVTLFINDSTDINPIIEGIPVNVINDGLEFSIEYPSPNIKFTRNTLPRLNKFQLT